VRWSIDHGGCGDAVPIVACEPIDGIVHGESVTAAAALRQCDGGGAAPV